MADAARRRPLSKLRTSYEPRAPLRPGAVEGSPGVSPPPPPRWCGGLPASCGRPRWPSNAITPWLPCPLLLAYYCQAVSSDGWTFDDELPALPNPYFIRLRRRATPTPRSLQRGNRARRLDHLTVYLPGVPPSFVPLCRCSFHLPAFRRRCRSWNATIGTATPSGRLPPLHGRRDATAGVRDPCRPQRPGQRGTRWPS